MLSVLNFLERIYSEMSWYKELRKTRTFSTEVYIFFQILFRAYSDTELCTVNKVLHLRYRNLKFVHINYKFN